MNSRITDTQMAEMFRQWWMDSYPTPPGTHAQITHLGWGRHLLLALEDEAFNQGTEPGQKSGD